MHSRHWAAVAVVLTTLCWRPALAAREEITELAGFEEEAVTFEGAPGDLGGMGAASRSAEAHVGTAALEFAYDFAGTEGTGFIYARASSRIELPPETDELRWFMRGDGTEHAMAMRIEDASGETYQFGVGYTDSTSWQEVRIRIESSAMNWGGDGNHRFDAPLTLKDFIIDKTAADLPETGAVLIDELVAVRKISAPLVRVDVIFEDFEGDAAPLLGGRGDQGGMGEASLSANGDGGQCLGFAYDFTGTTETAYIYARASGRIELPGRPERLTWRQQGDGTDRGLTIRLTDATGEFYQYTPCDISSTQWREASLDIGPEATHWGGNDDGVLDYPLTLIEFVIDKGRNDLPEQGEVFIDDLRVIGAVPEDELLTVSVRRVGDALVEPGTPSQAVVVGVRDWAQRDLTARLSVAAYALEGETLAEETSDVALASGLLSRQMDMPLAAIGPTEVRVEVSLEDAVATASTHIDALPPGARPERIDTSAFGINGHLPTRAELEMMQRAGIKWCRCDWLWGIHQPEAGDFHFERFDQLVADARDCGVRLLPILCYGVDWASTMTEGAEGSPTNYMPELDPWLAYVTATVERYRDDIDTWEVWNEPNIGFWLSTDEEYVTLLKETYGAIKAANPEALVAMGGTAGAPLDYIRMLYEFGCGDYMDIVNIHPYQYPRLPDRGLAGAIEAVHELMAEFGDADKPLWITEIGYPDHIGPTGVDRTKQAVYIARTYIISLATGIEKVFWYDYQNGADPAYNEHNFGIVFADGTPKQCLHALRTTAGQLEGLSYERTLVGEGAVGYMFSSGEERVLVAWALSESAELESPFAGAVTQTQLSGATETLELAEGEAIRLTEHPVFLSTGPGR